ncbi:hypothetical protein SAICODRAFT_7765 [Saitoella complicata NRRL Y-17804]|uniref:Uncharacterized protein n=1 Tax=Saitoella complicata (strain BCRC 22490 / CBS 7301 / JCM 7358 / NBRC 10748 / NRRL Y-17804) TaxID=698492 RepID=A0A0E9NCA3_SAICN|nr:uncharacterized protein SAICODRAFT_7765 [Saitoella complicata NRRL Y-17804]ODQ52728.1 hypothetical protein SAICODRAFT_7765 [Saitoella complicata NRRL Y-17804]GAO47423.1 hypothetical protein G7K_1631-t1 [Saitoella complicata NRRL Y-17804]
MSASPVILSPRLGPSTTSPLLSPRQSPLFHTHHRRRSVTPGPASSRGTSPALSLRSIDVSAEEHIPTLSISRSVVTLNKLNQNLNLAKGGDAAANARRRNSLPSKTRERQKLQLKHLSKLSGLPLSPDLLPLASPGGTGVMTPLTLDMEGLEIVEATADEMEKVQLGEARKKEIGMVGVDYFLVKENTREIVGKVVVEDDRNEKRDEKEHGVPES